MSRRNRNTHLARCPYCHERDSWLACGIWTCRRCFHSWPRRRAS